jgi:RNA polymerase sigma-70 factor (ECF subfamily)
VADSKASERPRCHAADDATLVAALQARDERAYAQAWTERAPMVRRLVTRFFGAGAEPLDLSQEVFVRFFRRIDELRNPEGLRGFLAGICLGVARNEARRMRVRRWVSLTPAGELPEVSVPSSDVEARQAMQRLYAALNRASALDRSLYVARYLEKMEVEEVARAHDLSFGTAKRRLARATARLNRILERDAALVAYLELPRAASPAQAGPREPSRAETPVRPAARLSAPAPYQTPGLSKARPVAKERA